MTYKLLPPNDVIHLPTGRVVPTTDPAFVAWSAAGGVPEPADVVIPEDPPPPPELNIRAEILDISQKALASGFLHIMMFDMMQRYLVQAQTIVPTVTEADLIDPQSPYYSKPYADIKVYYDQLVALQDLK